MFVDPGGCTWLTGWLGRKRSWFRVRLGRGRMMVCWWWWRRWLGRVFCVFFHPKLFPWGVSKCAGIHRCRCLFGFLEVQFNTYTIQVTFDAWFRWFGKYAQTCPKGFVYIHMAYGSCYYPTQPSTSHSKDRWGFFAAGFKLRTGHVRAGALMQWWSCQSHWRNRHCMVFWHGKLSLKTSHFSSSATSRHDFQQNMQVGCCWSGTCSQKILSPGLAGFKRSASWIRVRC